MNTNGANEYMRELEIRQQRIKEISKSISESLVRDTRSTVNELKKQYNSYEKERTKGIQAQIKKRQDFMRGFQKGRLAEEVQAAQQTLEAHKVAAEQIASEKARTAEEASEKTKTLSGEAIAQWTGMTMQANQLTSTAIMGTISTVGNGIANMLVEGTYDWKNALKQVLKQMISITAQLLIMQGIYAALGGAAFGPLGFLMHRGGKVLHTGGFAGMLHEGGLANLASPYIPKYDIGGQRKRNEIMAVLRRGEFVVNDWSVRQPGMRKILEQINATGKVPNSGPVVYNEGANITFAPQAIDSEGIERLFYEKFLPLLEQAERRGAYRPGSYRK